jgi:predicted RNA binding protein YcfA (HicA-like mRNA interferase family)
LKLPKGVSAREFTTALEADGFANIRTNGNHHFYKHQDGRCTTVSYHQTSDTFGIGLLKAMISDVDGLKMIFDDWTLLNSQRSLLVFLLPRI